MKLWIALMGIALLVTGCSTPSFQPESNDTIKKQAKLIVEQSEEIKKLKAKLAKKKHRKKYMRKHHSLKTKKTTTKTVKNLKVNPNKEKMIPKKQIKLKKVEDTNYSADYMYPGQKSTTKKVKTTTVKPVVKGISKAECISMVGAEKFAKYTQILGSEAASIRRCKMLKAMKN